MHKLPELGYEYNALEPYFDESTMKIHHTKHHQAYVDNLNKAIDQHKELEGKSAEELLMNLPTIPEDIRLIVRNHGGGHYNHSFFWKNLKLGTKPHGQLLEAINKKFTSFEKFVEQFNLSATKVFGSGWAWLVMDNGELEIMSTPNQDSPISLGKKPIIGIDVWEHAYYLKYQNRRPEYVAAFLHVVDWEQAEKNYLESKSK